MCRSIVGNAPQFPSSIRKVDHSVSRSNAFQKDSTFRLSCVVYTLRIPQEDTVFPGDQILTAHESSARSDRRQTEKFFDSAARVVPSRVTRQRCAILNSPRIGYL
jgi:hypothetical protein